MPSPQPRRSRASASPRAASSRASSSRSNSARPATSRSVSKATPARKAQKAPRSKPTIDPSDPGVQRRARKKAESKRKMWLSLLAVVAVSIPIGGAAWGVYDGYGDQLGLKQLHEEKVVPRRALLSDLQAQLRSQKQQLQQIGSREGREQALIEKGYVQPGERLLLFPKTPEKAN